MDRTASRNPARGPAAGVPAPWPVVATYLVGGLVGWLLAALAAVLAAPELAAGRLGAPDVLLVVHLLGLGVLAPAVTGAAFHVLPVLLRAESSPRMLAPLPLLAFGPVLAIAIARDDGLLAWTASVAVAAGLVIVAVEVVALVRRASRGRLALSSRVGILLSLAHAMLAFAAGALVLDRGWRSTLGVSHERWIAIHLHLAVIGWLTLLIVTVGRTLTPMLALAPSEPSRRLPVEELVLTAGLWTLLGGLATGTRAVTLVGGAVVLGAVARFGVVLVRSVRRSRLDAPEGMVAHVALGLVFLAQAALLGAALVVRWDVEPGRLAAYVVLLLLGWAGGVTLGHLGRLLALSAWTWWPPGERPRQLALYPRRAWVTEAAAFGVGVELVAVGALVGSDVVVRLGALALVCSALAALGAAAWTLDRAAPAWRHGARGAFSRSRGAPAGR